MREVKAALKRCRFIAILLLNFFVVPLFAVAVADLFGLEHNVTIGMVLLAAAPFAPVVPVFARMARADLALAAALTGVFPLVSAVLTPFAAQTALRFFARADVSSFGIWRSLAILMATTTLPLAVGVLVRHQAPKLGERLLRPVEVMSEAVGAASLAFVTATQFGSVVSLGWRSWLAMALISEGSLLLGWLLGGPERSSRQVIALGTSNRNIALALLVAIQNFRIEVAFGRCRQRPSPHRARAAACRVVAFWFRPGSNRLTNMRRARAPHPVRKNQASPPVPPGSNLSLGRTPRASIVVAFKTTLLAIGRASFAWKLLLIDQPKWR